MAIRNEKSNTHQSICGDVLILGIETSCDETAASVVKNGRQVLSSIISSQIDTHALYGGVVPEIASRRHVSDLQPIIQQALENANVTLGDISAIAVTYGPGLVGALLVGVSAAKGLAYATGKPLIAVHHIFGHICANFIAFDSLQPPFCCLIASGGHTMTVAVDDYNAFRLIGQTLDDAAGEAFDKAARLLNLPYPGGPLLDDISEGRNAHAITLPKVSTQGKYDMSFSGIKTALRNTLEKMKRSGEEIVVPDIAATFRRAVVEQLVDKTMAACEKEDARTLAVAGGVSANKLLRRELMAECEKRGITCRIPPIHLCTDNAAMIASAGYFLYNNKTFADLTLNAHPSARLIST